MNALPAGLVLAYAALLGAVIGSFLNVCIYRWPHEQSVIRPRSRCGACGAGIAWYDNVPVLSYLALRGRCRRCGVRISAQYPIVELATSLIWLAAAARFGISIEALHSALFLTLLLGIAMTDAQHMVIPDQFTVLGGLAGLGLAALPGTPAFWPALIGGTVGYTLMWAVKWIAEKALRKEALGVGDIHMIAMVGVYLGVGGALLTVMLGSVLGLVIGVPIMWIRGRLRMLETYLPLGTFLALGAAIAHAWGADIIGWYIGWISP
jgi:leader peptidase (prepilin peptidase) / N-methyltransferase